MTGIRGRFTPDPKRGIEWLRKAAEQGNAAAQHNLALALAQSAAQTVTAPK
jgi:TPR repeat protein